MNTLHDDRLTQRLAEVEAEQNRLDNELLKILRERTQIHEKKIPKSQETAFGILTLSQKKQHATTNPMTSGDTQGYVVCLMLNSKLQPEWTGKKWHVPGKGKCYPSIEQAHQCVQQLKRRWPNYIFQLLER